MTKPRVYVAASSREIPRASSVMAKLESAGFIITHNWIPGVLDAFAKGIAESKSDDAHAESAARADLDGVAAADLLVFLAPTDTSKMGWTELGYALALGIPCIVSHDDEERRKQSIVTRLAVQCVDGDIAETARAIAIERPRWIRHLENLRWLIGEVITHATKRVREPHRHAQLSEEIEGDLHGIGLAYVAAISLSGQNRS